MTHKKWIQIPLFDHFPYITRQVVYSNACGCVRP